jgi:diguanylate cyclase (GGDEF)-like protein/PAS domain S-box-containing protein
MSNAIKLPVLDTLLSNLPGMVYRCCNDESWTMQFVSAGAKELTGYDPEDLIDNRLLSYASLIHANDRQHVQIEVQKAIAKGRPFQVTYRIITADGVQKWVWEQGNAVLDQLGSLVALEGYITDITQSKQAQEVIHESEERFKNVVKATTDTIWDWNLKNDSLWWSEGMHEWFGFPLEELEPGIEAWANRIHPDDKLRVMDDIDAVINGSEENWTDEYRFLRKDGSFAYVLDRGFVIRDDDGQAARMVGSIIDLTARKQSELDLARLNRALQMRTACSELLIRATDEIGLLTDICRLAVNTGGYRMAWVGYAQDDDAKSIKIMTYAGTAADAEYINRMNPSWSKEIPTGRGPAGQVIRTGKSYAIENVLEEPSFAPWRAAAKKRGYRGAIILPLRSKETGRTFGVLALYSCGDFTVVGEETVLLQQLADDLSFGIGNIRTQQERQRIHAAVLTMAAGVSASTDTVFEQLVRSMIHAVGAQAGFIARLLPQKPLSARTITAVVDEKTIDNFDYVVEDMPCALLLQHRQYAIPAGAAEKFPHAYLLSNLKAKGYAGARLENSSREQVGQLFVLFRESIEQTDFVMSTLRIFATRAAGELQREVADARIREQASLLDKTNEAIIVRGLDNLVRFWNKGAERLYGYTAEEVIGQPISNLRLYGSAEVLQKPTRHVLAHGEWNGEFVECRKDGGILTVEEHWSLVLNDQGQPHAIFAITADITQRKADEREIQYLAYYDQLTQLPNRSLLMDRLQRALANNARNHHRGALLFIDLDNFKTLNDTLGHDMGDLLLQQVATRLKDCVRDSDTVARLGGDEFIVMLENLSDAEEEAMLQAKHIGEKILDRINEPFQLAHYEHHSTPSIGVTLFKDQRDQAGEILKRADLAMYQAKAVGRNALRFFDYPMQTAVSARAALQADIRQSLRDNHFLLYYQPQIDGENRITGVEALIRWQHPVRGFVVPDDFIALAEESGLILPLGQWVLHTACNQLVTWSRQAHMAPLSLAVNVSVRQMRHPEFVEQVLNVLDQTGANPYKLKLELTESVLVENVEDAIEKMTALKARGVGFSLDDFGTGYSSLSYLKRLPLDLIKIDQSFVRDLLTDPNDASIARTIVALAQSLGLDVIAEGVETEVQREFLALNGCRAYQGFLCSPPLPAAELEALVSKQRARNNTRFGQSN